MFRRILSMITAGIIFISLLPSAIAENNMEIYGFESKEEVWNSQYSNGRISRGYDTEKFRSGERSYKFSAVTSSEGENEISEISKSFDVEYKSAYKVGMWYLLSEDYARIDAETGGAFFSYVLLDSSGMEIPDSSYSYYLSSKSYEDDIYSEHWSGKDF